MNALPLNIMLTLSREEAEALIAWWAAKIGHGSEAESDMASKRIAQLRGLTAPERRYDIEHLAAYDWPVFFGVDFGAGDDMTTWAPRPTDPHPPTRRPWARPSPSPPAAGWPR